MLQLEHFEAIANQLGDRSPSQLPPPAAALALLTAKATQQLDARLRRAKHAAMPSRWRGHTALGMGATPSSGKVSTAAKPCCRHEAAVCDVTVHRSPQGRKGPPTHERGGAQHNQASKPPHALPSPCQGTEVPWTYQWENPQAWAERAANGSRSNH